MSEFHRDHRDMRKEFSKEFSKDFGRDAPGILKGFNKQWGEPMDF